MTKNLLSGPGSLVTGKFTFEDAESLYYVFFWKERQNPDFAENMILLESAVKLIGKSIQRPEIKDWSEINKRKTQVSFDLLFNSELLLKEIEKIFLEIGKNSLTQEDIFSYRTAHNRYLDESFLTPAVELLRDFTMKGHIVVFDEIQTFTKQLDNFINYQIREIHDYLTGLYSRFIEVNFQQIQFIKSWCTNKGDDWRILWFFLNRFNISLPEDKIFDLTLYYDFNAESKLSDPGTIEQLEKFLPQEKLKKRVVKNLEDGIEDSLSWMSNAGYAIRKNIRNTFPFIIRRLENALDNEYKFSEVLEIWFKKFRTVQS